MSDQQQDYRRRSIRLKNYDYCLPGAYFITLVTWQRACLFGECAGGKMKLSAFGDIVQSEWSKLSSHFTHLRCDAFVVMPNHFHGIIVIDSHLMVGATRPEVNQLSNRLNLTSNKGLDRRGGSPLQEICRSNGPISGSLGAIIGQFKSRVTKRIRKLPGMDGQLIWQRNYYEHIICYEKSLENIHNYILENPANWSEDEYIVYRKET